MKDISPPQERLILGDEAVSEILCERGTPLYVLSEPHLRERIRRYKAALKASYPKTELAYASKANSTLVVLAIADDEGCKIDIASKGELMAALQAGVFAEDCHFHGNNKSEEELSFAIESEVGQIVVDNFEEIDLLHSFKSEKPPLVLRLAPGVDPKTHKKISTGQEDTKFGFNIADGSAEKALLKCLESKLPVIGFHCHVGSQLIDPEAQEAGGRTLAEFAVEMLNKHGFRTEVINVGGGLGVQTKAESPMPIEDYCMLISKAVKEGLGDSGLEPTLMQEPGRALISDSGVTLYRVGVRKTVPLPGGGQRTYLIVDGGLADNPRPAMYGAEYEVIARGFGRKLSPQMEIFTVAGRHCETDTLFEDIALPADVRPGDSLQILSTGAYNSSMASNYNRYPRPETLLLRPDGSLFRAQAPETYSQILARESVPGDL
ncbi:MAG: diaminopimelate decarboxylase [Fimbriimonadaceae bacterium]|nr:diaminopimelate decarboxylase [Fimbriimonadaceae bacterium]